MIIFERDMTATIAADLPLGVIQEKLGAVGQWLPIDGDPAIAVGLLVAGNSSGPLRLGYGAWRDLLLGCQFRNGRGELITAGGRAVKNVAGYDLTKFMVGQRGAFGEIVSLTTRTYRMPAGTIVATYTPDLRVVHELIPSPLRPHWMLLKADALLCGYLGDDRTLDFYQKALAGADTLDVVRRTVEEDIEQRARLWRSRVGGFRAAVPPARILEFIEACRPGDWVADPVFGIVLGSDASEVKAAAEAVGGTAYVIDAGGVSADWQPSDVEQRLVQRLRSAFNDMKS